MNGIDNISSLTEQLIRMSDYSPYFQFVLMNKEKILVTSILLVMMLALVEDKAKNLSLVKTTIFFAILSIILIILTTVAISQRNDLRQKDLIKDQIDLVKSIPSPIFQDFVKESIQTRGATISAIDIAVDRFEFKQSALEKGTRGMELYNSVEPK